MAPWQRRQQWRHHQPDMQSYIAVGMRVPPKEAYASSTGSAWQCWWDTLHMTSSVGMASWRGAGSACDAVAGVPRSSPYAHRAPCLESSELELGPPLCLKGAIIQCTKMNKNKINVRYQRSKASNHFKASTITCIKHVVITDSDTVSFVVQRQFPIA